MATGKLKKTLDEKCPDCHERLQLRSLKIFEILNGEEVCIENDIIICPNCGAKRKFEKQRKFKEGAEEFS